ncbi:5-oxopent-3-ene-1,2,5-tricarboxylate decarboxylase [Burkholderia sp. Nafp2/4-1b]|uniref:fumarylacetoacetate hydrolase family protein n=1 Tax=Burkholderia sp. Nafp2/4-1b TaxID=2116686 RepID=UPI000EF8E881|nr:fumarylacetoacetate hydrolase family protein [Burkholderia sp. Nafp2/4-1b]RKT98715.1 5-oxopent-3-ene-1,2,5-tricarboxylate decarboxylase [Burkholderia sp. Nafp2/4-1b]
MRYVSFMLDGKTMLGVRERGKIRLLGEETLDNLLACGYDLSEYAASNGTSILLDESALTLLPPLSRPSKIICIGLNYLDHTAETDLAQPDYPTVFLRAATSLVAHNTPMIKPAASDSFDYEGELAVVLGKGGRHIRKADALTHVAGYSLFNDGSVREYQFKTPQWTIGKNFDGTGAFGPDLVTADELPLGATGLLLETKLNGEVVQSCSTAHMIFDVATLITVLSEAMTLEAGDVIVSGTPAGIGWTRTPRLLMKDGDVCEVSVEGLGVLRNTIANEARQSQFACHEQS